MLLLTGCVNSNASMSGIGEVGIDTIRQELIYNTEQEGIILLSDLEKEFQNNNMPLIKNTHPDAMKGQYNLEDDRARITILVDSLTSPGHQFISDIFIEPLNNYMLLFEHPAIKIIADVMGEEQLLTWVAERESEMTQAGKNNEMIQELLAIDRCYLFFEYRPESDTRRLDFRWALKPDISMAFEEIAHYLEQNGMLITGYIEGTGGESLIATNSEYYILKKTAYSMDKKIPIDIDQAAAYQVMHDKNKPGNYSLQLHGYMRDDLSYPTQLEAMPGLDKITQLMDMGQEDFLAIADEINKELTEAKRIRNNNLNGVYYFEGELGGYRYIITVPQGILLYNFTVLIEKI